MTPNRFMARRYCIDTPLLVITVMCASFEEANEVIDTWLRHCEDQPGIVMEIYLNRGRCWEMLVHKVTIDTQFDF